MHGSTVLLEYDDERDPPIVSFETRNRGTYVTGEASVADYRIALDDVTADALSKVATVDLMSGSPHRSGGGFRVFIPESLHPAALVSDQPDLSCAFTVTAVLTPVCRPVRCPVPFFLAYKTVVGFDIG